MCGHGIIGVIATLYYLNRIQAGSHKIETPVGTVTAELHESGEITITNVASYRFASRVGVDVAGHGRIYGDVAWGGNWFFLVNDHDQELCLARVDELTDFTWRIREALARQGIAGEAGQEIDHIELFGPPTDGRADSKNFVLCPGKAYDRSPCGTGTSAKLACLYADGKLKPEQTWRQESIVGSMFEGSLSLAEGKLYPRIKGTAFINAESDLIFDDRDPFCMGIRR
jgi:4-hydroxyproline epimerase